MRTEKLAAALEAARNGLQWYRDTYPNADSGADDEMMAQIDEALDPPTLHHGLDTDDRVCFYEQEFYVLSNFSSFTLDWRGHRFDTAEAAYHFEKFPRDHGIRMQILYAASAHEAYQIANRYKKDRRPDWDSMKVEIMRAILRTKAKDHEYVRRKLLETGLRELVENSWRDDFWGWGPNRDGQNMLGKLWMDVRAEFRAAQLNVANTAKD